MRAVALGWTRCLSITWLAGSGLVVASCARDASGPARPATAEAYEILVEPGQLDLSAGGSASLSAQANDSKGLPIGGAPLKFDSEDPAVIRVSERGTVESLGRTVPRAFVIVSSGTRMKRVPVSVAAGPLDRLEKVSGDEQTLVAGAAPMAVQVRAIDAWGNPIADQRLMLTGESGGEPRSGQTSSDGMATFPIEPLRQAGSTHFTVRPADGDQPAETFTFQISPGPPARLLAERTSDPGTGAAGFRVRAMDSFENPVPGAGVRVKPPASLGEEATPETGADGWATLSIHVSDELRPKLRVVEFTLAEDEKISTTAPLAQ